MPISPENRHRYPANWKTEITPRIRLRARNRCECRGECGEPHKHGRCNLANGWWGWRDAAGEFHGVSKYALMDAGATRPPFDLAATDAKGSRLTLHVIKIVLTVAHLDHQPENCAEDNLRAMCQRCHLRYDVQHHRATRRNRKAVGDLFTGSVSHD